MSESKSKKISIAILLGAPLTAQNFERVGIPYLSKHFEIIVLDCSVWIGRPHYVYQGHNSVIITRIDSEIEFCKNIEKYNPKYAIDFIGFGNFTNVICQILSIYGVTFIVQKMGNVPVGSIFHRIQYRIRNNFFRKPWVGYQSRDKNSLVLKSNEGPRITSLSNKLRAKLQERLKLFHISTMPNFIGLLAGDKAYDSLTKKANPIIWVGSHDYHTFKKLTNDSRFDGRPLNGSPYILYIDDALADAADFKILDLTPPVTSRLFYSSLNKFFEVIERKFGMPIIIAGHPNHLDDKNFQNAVGGSRKIIFGDTARLALNSHLVLAHCSTAISFAVMAKKPIIFLTTYELDRSNYGSQISAMAKILNCPLILIDEEKDYFSNINPLNIDQARYGLYETNYLRSDLSRELEPWGALIEHIKFNSTVKSERNIEAN